MTHQRINVSTVGKPNFGRVAAWLIPLALFLATVALYWPARQFEFLNWDDLTFIQNNEHVRGGFTWESAKWFFTHAYSANWAPLSWISHMLDVQFYGLNPGGHHLTNILLHAANAALLFLALRALTNRIWPSAFVAGLFAFHPLHIESVAWIAERRDVLSTFFGLLALFSYATYCRRRREESGAVTGTRSQKDSSRRRLQWKWYLLALFLFALSLLSKPMLVTLPCLLFLLDFWPLNRMRFNVEGWKLKASPGSIGVERSPSEAAPQPATTSSSIQHPSSSSGRRSFILHPSSLILILEKLPFFALTVVSCIITFISQKQAGAVASLEKVTFVSRLENAAVAYLQYLQKFFWPANLSPFYPHPTHWETWRVSLAFLVLVLLLVLVFALRRRAPYLLVGYLWFLGTLVPVIGIVQVGSQAFADRYTYIPLIGIMIAVVWLVAEVFSSRRLGPEIEDENEDDDEKDHRASGIRRPTHIPSTINYPLSTLALAILAVLCWRTSAQLPYWRDTETLFHRALQISPNNIQALYGLGTTLIDAGRVDEGLPYLKEAIRLQPSYPEALGAMGNLMDTQGNYAEAIRFYEAGLNAAPNQSGILNNLAWLRAACADPKFRDGPEAVRLAKRACELTDYSKPLFIGTLAAAQAEAGDFQSAVATAERAADLATRLKLDDIADKNLKLIDLYRQGKNALGQPVSLHK